MWNTLLNLNTFGSTVTRNRIVRPPQKALFPIAIRIHVEYCSESELVRQHGDSESNNWATTKKLRFLCHTLPCFSLVFHNRRQCSSKGLINMAQALLQLLSPPLSGQRAIKAASLQTNHPRCWRTIMGLIGSLHH